MAKNRKPRPSYHQGIYKPRYPEKNINKTPIEYRSQLELDYMWRIDNSPNITRWGSEVVFVPYTHPLKKKPSQYWTDLYIETKSHGPIVVEIKPQKEITAIVEGKSPQPRKNKKQTTFIYEMKMFLINKAKWQAASDFCRARNWAFITVSEAHLKENRVPFL